MTPSTVKLWDRVIRQLKGILKALEEWVHEEESKMIKERSKQK